MTEHIGIDDLGYDKKLYVLAFDHRGSFERMVGDVDRVAGAKTLIWEGFKRAIEQGAPKEFAGVLVDGQYGPDVARRQRPAATSSQCRSRSPGRSSSTSSTARGSASKIEEYDPDFSKVLVRYNPEGDRR